MKLKKAIFSEGAGYIHAITQERTDAYKWLGRFRGNGNFKSVEINDASDVEVGVKTFHQPYRFVVSAEKHGTWWSDEFPFRAGVWFLFINTVISSTDESKLQSLGIIS